MRVRHCQIHVRYTSDVYDTGKAEKKDTVRFSYTTPSVLIPPSVLIGVVSSLLVRSAESACISKQGARGLKGGNE